MQVLEYLGSAAFSRAVQCLDLETNRSDVPEKRSCDGTMGFPSGEGLGIYIYIYDIIYIRIYIYIYIQIYTCNNILYI